MGCDQAWRAFDVAEAVRTWSAQPWTAFGLGLRAESEPNGATLRQFLSWNYCACAQAIPQIDILWRETYDPYGAVDLAEAGVGGVRVAGWAIDPDTTAPIPVHVYVGAAGTAVTADGYRPDVGAAFGLGDYHGYDAFIPATSGTHQVCLYAINVAGAGSNQQIGCRTLTISGEPFGAIDEVTGVANGVKVRGWAIDPDTTAPIQLQVSVSGAVTTIAADKDRPDIGAAYPRYGSLHGYDSTIPVAGAGLKTVCITALNAAGQGGNPSFGCRTVNVAMLATAPTELRVSSPNQTVQAEWRAPDFDGASPITSYTAIVYRADNGAEVARKSVPPIFDGGGSAAFWVTNGQGYYVTVYGTNAVGNGATTTSGSVMPVASPDSPFELLGDGNPATMTATCRTSWGVSCASGNFSKSFADLEVPGRGRALQFTRTYNAQAHSLGGPLGTGWTHSYDMRLEVVEGLWVNVFQENGSMVRFYPDDQGGYRAHSHVFATLTRNADDTWTFTRKRDLASFVFEPSPAVPPGTNPVSRVLRETDANNYVTTLSYTDGRLSAVTDAAARSLTFSYNAEGLLERVADPAGRDVTFGYEDGRNTSVTDAGDEVTRFAYDTGEGHLISITDPRGQVLSNDYDCATLCQSGPGRSFSYTYEQTGPSTTTTTIVDPRGHTVIARHDWGRLVSITRGAGSVDEATWTYQYDPVTMGLISETDPNQHTWISTFDANGNQTSHKDPLQREWTATYTPTNRLATMRDASQVTTTYTYDAGSNLKTISRPLVGTAQTATTTFGYDPARPGDLVSVTDPTNRKWLLAYDAVGNRNRSEDPLGNVTTFGHDLAGRVEWSVAPKGNVAGANPATYKTTFAHNAYGDLKSVKDPLLHEQTWTYYPDRLLKTYTDANLHTTTYEYNAYDEPIKTIRPDTTVERTDYDANGNVETQTDPLLRTTTYRYDALNRPTEVIDPLNRSTRATFDGAGNRKTVVDAAQRTTTFGYNNANELTSIDYSDAGTPDVAFSYTALGQRATMTDGTGNSTYTWDSLGRLTSHKNGANRTVGYGYDLADRLTTIDYPALSGVAAGRVTRAYDGAGRLWTVTDWANRKHTFTYDAHDNIKTQTYPNAAVATYTYDAADRLTNLAHAKGNKSIASFGYTLDSADLITSENAQSYTYDVNDRLKTSSGTPVASYNYDGADNPTTLVSGSVTSTLAPDAAHQLTSLTSRDGQSFTFTYDDLGNRTAKKTTAGAVVASYGYDQANRLVSTGSTGYTYDGDGLRMTKSGSGATTFVWDVAEGLPVVLADGATRYVTGPGGLPLHQVTSAGVPSYYHVDQLGSTRALTDSTGKVVATYAYDPYGNLVNSAGTMANPFRYAGQYADAESGLQQLRARYYDPSTAQFLSRDPLEALTSQPYTYADNSPLNATDPTGLNCQAGSQVGTGAAARVNVLAAAGPPAVRLPCKPGGIDKHHTIPREILKKLPPDVANHPAVRGRAGAPNRWPLPTSLHKRVHGKGGGPKFNTAWKAELGALGGPPTVDDVLAIRDMLAKRFGFWHCKP